MDKVYGPSKLASVYRLWWYLQKIREFNDQLRLAYMIPQRSEEELADIPIVVEAKNRSNAVISIDELPYPL